MCVCGISKPTQTKLNQSKLKTFSTINSILSAWNEIKSKVPEKFARAAQLLYRPVLVKLSNDSVAVAASYNSIFAKVQLKASTLKYSTHIM